MLSYEFVLPSLFSCEPNLEAKDTDIERSKKIIKNFICFIFFIIMKNVNMIKFIGLL